MKLNELKRINGKTIGTGKSLREIAEAHYCDLRDADLEGADLGKADLRGADLRGANLQGTGLREADLEESDLAEADMEDAYLRGANLRGANLRDAYLGGAGLECAALAGATMPDGRTWEEYVADPLAGICHTPEARQRAIAAMGEHSWADCPMHAALGVYGLRELDDHSLRLRVAAFVAVHDARLWPENDPWWVV